MRQCRPEKHAFKEVDPAQTRPQHPGGLNRADYRRIVRPWRVRKLAARRQQQLVLAQLERAAIARLIGHKIRENIRDEQDRQRRRSEDAAAA